MVANGISDQVIQVGPAEQQARYGSALGPRSVFYLNQLSKRFGDDSVTHRRRAHGVDQYSL